LHDKFGVEIGVRVEVGVGVEVGVEIGVKYPAELHSTRDDFHSSLE